MACSRATRLAPPRTVEISGLVVGVDLHHVTVSVEGEDTIRYRPARHARRSIDHTGHGETGDNRLLVEHAGDVACRHVPLDQVAVGLREVAAGERRADVVLGPHGVDDVTADEAGGDFEAILT